MAVLAAESTIFWVSGLDDTDGVSIHQRWVTGGHVPRRTILPLSLMRIDVVLSSTVHPLLQSTPVERRAPAWNWGKICPSRTSGGSIGRSRRQVWVEMTVLPSSIIIMMGGVAILRLWCGVSTDIQCPVNPELAMSLGDRGKCLAANAYFLLN